jgi:hypothetical protein
LAQRAKLYGKQQTKPGKPATPAKQGNQSIADAHPARQQTVDQINESIKYQGRRIKMLSSQPANTFSDGYSHDAMGDRGEKARLERYLSETLAFEEDSNKRLEAACKYRAECEREPSKRVGIPMNASPEEWDIYFKHDDQFRVRNPVYNLSVIAPGPSSVDKSNDNHASDPSQDVAKTGNIDPGNIDPELLKYDQDQLAATQAASLYPFLIEDDIDPEPAGSSSPTYYDQESMRSHRPVFQDMRVSTPETRRTILQQTSLLQDHLHKKVDLAMFDHHGRVLVTLDGQRIGWREFDTVSNQKQRPSTVAVLSPSQNNRHIPTNKNFDDMNAGQNMPQRGYGLTSSTTPKVYQSPYQSQHQSQHQFQLQSPYQSPYQSTYQYSMYCTSKEDMVS